MANKVLVADDDPHIRRLVGELLSAEGYVVLFAEDGEQALHLWRTEGPDLVILDIIMPGADGLEVCRRLREETGVPIIFLTARDEEEDVVRGLSSGGDDYITKPFRGAELVARVKAVLRRASMAVPPGEEERISVSGLEVDKTRHEVTVHGKPVYLTQTEFEILWLLASHRGKPFTRQEIARALWGHGNIGLSRSIDTHIARLRKKIERDHSHPEFIKTVTGVGYKFL
jgi:DNA-binding response OmpR family regulator